jgi:hypothetical protein
MVIWRIGTAKCVWTHLWHLKLIFRPDMQQPESVTSELIWTHPQPESWVCLKVECVCSLQDWTSKGTYQVQLWTVIIRFLLLFMKPDLKQSRKVTKRSHLFKKRHGGTDSRTVGGGTANISFRSHQFTTTVQGHFVLLPSACITSTSM